MKFAEARPKESGTPQVDIAIPVFGDKNHISIHRRHGIIRREKTADAATHDGARLREGLIDPATRISGLTRPIVQRLERFAVFEVEDSRIA